ncbi:uncharacterized protein LOC129727866 [Wyeomyia smithii]|uniref:uncharacterized protein LOC129727866 n=1 Tax=Wyeomyia smithii TaxID=174621 RepID=UPI00246809A2|nr:uncharacterized protein LOC129727866 [Wyeomyia smithii]
MEVNRKFVSVILFCAWAHATVVNHTCTPIGYSKFCIMYDVNYSRDNITTHIFPKGYPHVRIVNDGWPYETKSDVNVLDSELYDNLDRPEAIELVKVGLHVLEIPRILKMGNFAHNLLREFSIGIGEAEPMLAFLDVTSNYISDLRNISSLVNLEILYLSYNRIQTINQHDFKGLEKLKILILNRNSIAQLSLVVFPSGLTSLSILGSDITELDYEQMMLPELETFNIEHNRISTINITALLLGMPKLKTFQMDDNRLSYSNLQEALDILKRKNISLKKPHEEYRCHEEEYSEGACQEPPTRTNKGWLAATGLSILVILVGSMFVSIVWRVYVEINK